MTETRIRRACVTDAEAIAAVHVAAWRETYAALMPADLLAGLSVSERAANWRRILDKPNPAVGTVAFVACVPDGSVAGFGSCGQQRSPDLAEAGFGGEFQAVYVLRSAQRRGVGRALMVAMAQSLMSRNVRGGGLWVLEANHPARRFYEMLGGEVVGKREDRRGEGVVLAEVAYGWASVDLIGAAP